MQSDHKQALVREEQEACDTPLDARIHHVDLVEDDMGARDRELNCLADKYSDVFRNRDDAIFFAMLPLTAVDRDGVLTRAREIMKIEAEQYRNFSGSLEASSGTT